jgi:hypothetical protein
MISPKLKFGAWHSQELRGLVMTSYANPEFVKSTCTTPIDQGLDPMEGGSACLDVQYSGQSYHNLLAFMSEWETIRDNGNSSLDSIDVRPPGKHTLFDNTTLASSWIETEFSDPVKSFETHKRVVNNVTLAMPHAGVYLAAIDPENGILQPQDLSGLGEYSVRAAVVSPSVNVMCVNMAESELAPLVYTTWPDARNSPTDMPGQQTGVEDWYEDIPFADENEWFNSTVVDDLFRWGSKYERRPPLFQLVSIS